MPDMTPEDIVGLIDEQDNDTNTLRGRMRSDYDLYSLDDESGDTDYKTYTSNMPRVFADKIISWQVSAVLGIRIPYGASKKDQRTKLEVKERFIIGLLNQADERLRRILLPSLRNQLAWYTSLRGMYAGRALIRKNDSGHYVDIMPWDPLHTYWSIGSDGLDWACYKFRRTRDELASHYGLDVSSMDKDEGADVYDYYDQEQNGLIVNKEWVPGFELQPHGSPRIPVFIGLVGSQPPIQQMNGEDTIGDYAESVYSSVRGIIPVWNELMSIVYELVSRSRKPPITFESRDGTKTLEEDPFKEGSEISLSQGEKVAALDLLQAAKDTAAFLGLVSGEYQRGSLPFSIFGELQFQLSGFAITTLRQGIDTMLQPRMQALESAYLDISNLLTDQFATGHFPAMQLSGVGQNREWFDESFDPEAIKDLPSPRIRLSGKLPEDEAAKFAMAKLAREGQNPFMPDRYLMDEVIKVEDADLIDRQLKEQQASRMSPLGGMFVHLRALLESGEQEQAMIMTQEIQDLMLQRELAISQALGAAGLPPDAAGGGMPGGGMPGGGPIPGNGMPGGPVPGNGTIPGGLPPQVAPPAAQGVPPPIPTPQAGPNVPPGSPRPGALTEEQRLSNIGLVGPRG